MIRTQIQLPDEVHARARRFCEAREMSLAELARRGIEQVLDQYPERAGVDWELPVIAGGRIRVPLKRLREVAADEEASRGVGRGGE